MSTSNNVDKTLEDSTLGLTKETSIMVGSTPQGSQPVPSVKGKKPTR